MILSIGNEVRLCAGFDSCNKCNVISRFANSARPGEVGKIIQITNKNNLTVVFGNHVKGNNDGNKIGHSQSICVDHLEIKVSPMASLFESEPFKTMRAAFCKQYHINTVL